MLPLLPKPIDIHPVIAARGMQDKRRDISAMLRALQTMGRFLATCFGETFFFDESARQVVPILEGDRDFMRIMGTHGVSPDKTFIERARQYALTYGTSTEICRMSHVDTASSAIYVYSQGRDVFKVTDSGITTIGNGDDDIYFLREQGSTPFTMVDLLPSGDDLFLEHIVKPLPLAATSMHKEQSQFLVIAWFCSLFIPELLPMMPLLVLVGPPSSGKTTFARLVSELLFGSQVSIIRTPGDTKNFDRAIGRRRFVCMDNVTEWNPWLDERLESIARRETIIVGKGQAIVEQRLDCAMVMTARQYPDEGLQCINRMLPIVLERPEQSLPERLLLDGVRRHRNTIMTQLLLRLQQLMVDIGSAGPGYSGSYTLADFADVTCRIARTIGFEEKAANALDRLAGLQDTALPAERQVVQLLELWLSNQSNEERKLKATELQQEISEIAKEQGMKFAMSERSFAHWIKSHIAVIRQYFSVDMLEERSRQLFYRIRMKQVDPTHGQGADV